MTLFDGVGYVARRFRDDLEAADDRELGLHILLEGDRIAPFDKSADLRGGIGDVPDDIWEGSADASLAGLCH